MAPNRTTLSVDDPDPDDIPLRRATFYSRSPLRLDVYPFLLAYAFAFGSYVLDPELEVLAIVLTPCVVLLHLLLFLVTQWSVGVRCATQFSARPPADATHVYTVAATGSVTLLPLERETLPPPAEAEAAAAPGAPAPSLFFVYHKGKYLVETLHTGGDPVVRKLRMPADEYAP